MLSSLVVAPRSSCFLSCTSSSSFIIIFFLSLLQWAIPVEGTFEALEKIGKTIIEPFPNSPRNIIGVGGLSYEPLTNTWTTSSENIPGVIDDLYPGVSLPKLNHMELDFETGKVTYINSEPIVVNPSNGLKLEDIASIPLKEKSDEFFRSKDFWLVSEANSDIVKTNTFLSKNFGAPDLNSFDTETFVTSRLIRVDAMTGDILEEATIPDFAQWNMEYDWESTHCVGDRPFQGLHALSIIPASLSNSPEDSQYQYLMFVGAQSSLFQDGDKATEFSGSATRVLVYGLNPMEEEEKRLEPTATYLRSLRYDTSQLTMKSFQKGSRHFNALFGLLVLDEKRFLFVECEELSSNGFSTHSTKMMNRIFYVEMDQNDVVDGCKSLTKDSCPVDAPQKRLVWEREDNLEVDGIALGPILEDGRPTIALTSENDDKIGLHIELFALNEEKLSAGEPWEVVDRKKILLRQRQIAVWVSVALITIIILAQHFLARCKNAKKDSLPSDSTEHVAFYKKYAIISAYLNSFLVGGVTFGYSGMVLILRKEGIYADNCACGSFCAKQKEALALVSTVGFASAIGCRLFVGLFMDHYGPKLTSVICCSICFSGFLLLAITNSSELEDIFMTAFILISIGGSGLHICGFHLTNLFKGDGKKRASAGISAAFGASSIVFPVMQMFNQFADVSLQSMAIFYSVVVALVLVNNLFIQPWDKLTPTKDFRVSMQISSKDFWKRDNGSSFLRRSERKSDASLKTQLMQFEFYGEVCFFSVSLFALTHYLSTSTQIMYEKGDVSFTNNPNNLNDFMISRMAGYLNGLGFLWVTTVKYLMTRYEWPRCFLLIAILNIVVMGIVLVKNLEVQILGFTVLSFTRLLLFSTHHTFLLDRFGIGNFGTLNGISAFVAAILGFSSFPLQIYGLQVGYSISYSLIGCGVVLSLIFPIILRKRVSAEKKAMQVEANDDMEGKLNNREPSSDIGKDSHIPNPETSLDGRSTSKENVEVDEWIGSIPTSTEKMETK
ncbi:hypothetical protein CTEN210_01192 [Chaetoceros tenuissimus]|uniref:Uncharacterized protein n=1 Tax=Chaetoceros tenuissimus TaxID=426638 RepID=A0AAD3GZN2_9STRA|nr:hypothetical protein CTEN210_01192 [Chaetoceros tenuissimus]